MIQFFDRPSPPFEDKTDERAADTNTKTCPCCGGKLERGFVQSAREIFWGPNMHKARFSPKEKDGEFYLPQQRGCPAFSGVCPADYCASCHLILIPMDEEEPL
ncbi:hypothetical protein OBV_29810 [Oscillibacter valericigenes Sjm18-20]|nr:hypothetical protein OBV_29810 [Oscillibacter valericigenes Sjm18-20]